MRKRVLPFLAAVAAAVICVAPTALAGNRTETAPATPPPAIEQAVTAPPVCSNPIYPPPISFYEYEQRWALDYLRSPERINRFKADFEKAGVLIAKGLDSGKFAPVTKRYDEQKNDRKPGYSGWGGISTYDNAFYAWVWWFPRGSISYTKMGVTGFAISDGYTRLQIEQLDSGDGPYHVFLSEGAGFTRVTSTHFSTNSVVEDYVYPRAMSDLYWLDSDALVSLNHLMTIHFGRNWRELP